MILVHTSQVAVSDHHLHSSKEVLKDFIDQPSRSSSSSGNSVSNNNNSSSRSKNNEDDDDELGDKNHRRLSNKDSSDKKKAIAAPASANLRGTNYDDSQRESAAAAAAAADASPNGVDFSTHHLKSRNSIPKQSSPILQPEKNSDLQHEGLHSKSFISHTSPLQLVDQSKNRLNDSFHETFQHLQQSHSHQQQQSDLLIHLSKRLKQTSSRRDMWKLSAAAGGAESGDASPSDSPTRMLLAECEYANIIKAEARIYSHDIPINFLALFSVAILVLLSHITSEEQS